MSATQTKIQFDGKYIARLAITLLAITAVAALLLSVVYSVTKPTIEALAEQTRKESMAASYGRRHKLYPCRVQRH